MPSPHIRHDHLDIKPVDVGRNWLSKRLEFAPDGGLTLGDYGDVVAQLMERVQDKPVRLHFCSISRPEAASCAIDHCTHSRRRSR